MDINTIPHRYDEGIGLHHLLVLDVLLREHSLTRAAKVLNVTQPALSKTLARLRRHFSDPLFVRVSLRMEPTSKALSLQAPVAAILDQLRALQSEHIPFDPRISSRTFRFCVVDAGVIKLMPPLVKHLEKNAPHVRIQAMHLDTQHLNSWLESGKVDFAMGSFPSLVKGIRRQPLWTERYVSVARRGHPRLGRRPSLRDFSSEKHVLVSIAGAGHAHRLAEQAIEAIVPEENIICRVPIFTAAAVVARDTNAIATLPQSIAAAFAEDFDLEILTPPVKLPRIEISQYWHERFHREPGNQWIRATFLKLFRQTAGK